MGEHRISSGPPGRQSLTFSADETLEDGSTVRTLETPAATIRFCFIDNVSSDSDSDSEGVPDSVEPQKPPDVMPSTTSPGTKTNNGVPLWSTSNKEAVETVCQQNSHEMNSSDNLKNENKDSRDQVKDRCVTGDGALEMQDSDMTLVKEMQNRTECDDESMSAPSPSQKENLVKEEVSEEKKDAVPSPSDVKLASKSRIVDSEKDHSSPVVPVDERFINSSLKTEIAITKGFVKECSSSPEQKSSSDRQSEETSSSTGSLSSNVASMPRSPRFNPFDHDVFVEEDHFSYHDSLLKGNPARESRQSLPNVISPISKTRARTNSEDYPRSVSSDDSSFLIKDENDITFADLGLTEDHFSQPEGFFGLSTTEELELAIESCKEMIMETGDNLERKKNLVGKLIQLRIRLQDAKEGPVETTVDADTKLVLGHKFAKRETGRSKHYCEKCNNVIWGMLQIWYRCDECGFCCHGKCLNLITRMCASIKVADNPTYILTICPEKGLAAQQYRCSECRTVISFKNNFDEPRQCDYTGGYYCELCHWNDTMVVPARVLHNWDFEPRKVCRASKQFLKLMRKKSVLRIQDINPMLFSFVEELNEVKKLREEILVMKKYFLSCQDALASKLLLQLQDRQHFVDNSDMYSMQDLLDIASEDLVPKLTKIHASFAQHIKADCELCQVKGFICELCDSQEILFPFDNHAIVCSQCSAVLHRHCYMRRDNSCPRCERRNKRAAEDAGGS